MTSGGEEEREQGSLHTAQQTDRQGVKQITETFSLTSGGEEERARIPAHSTAKIDRGGKANNRNI